MANSGAWAALAILSAICVVAYAGVITVYRLYFHPLAKYPGPLFARVSPIPFTYHLLKGRIPFWIKAHHDTYGPIVRVSPNELCFDDAAAWKDIYGSRPGHTNFHKDPIHVGSIQSLPGVTTITMAGDADHARQRRALSHAFSTKALLEQEYIVKSYVDVFSDKMKAFARNGEPVNVTDWFAFTTFDIIGDMALGKPFGCLENKDFHFWVPLISESIKAGAIEQATRRIATTGSLLQRLLLRCIPSSISKTRQQHLEYSRENILARMARTDSDHRDFLYYLMRQQDKEQLNLDEVIVNGALFIIAGTETTAGFLAGLFNQIARPKNRHVLERLTQEIRDNFDSDEDLKFERLAQLPYMTAVIEEGLRIYPSAPIGFVRTVPHGGDTVCGEMLPAGTTVSVTMWAATHSERNFSDPYEFRPERWMDKDNATDKLHASNPFVYPGNILTKTSADLLAHHYRFSLGPRGCIGRNLSYMEMRLIIGKLLWHNDVGMAGNNDSWDPKHEHENMVVYNNWIKPELWMKLTPRRQ